MCFTLFRSTTWAIGETYTSSQTHTYPIIGLGLLTTTLVKLVIYIYIYSISKNIFNFEVILKDETLYIEFSHFVIQLPTFVIFFYVFFFLLMTLKWPTDALKNL